ncbi:MAG: sulfite exporter TauE/SafE family protein [Deltaproteobacteria bacterium]|nr:sulfite exporter TauE/SafE family protein [Deltaproteobacteria bacterium]
MAEPLSLALILAYVTAGFAGGFLGGFMGVGGGIIFVPALDFLFRHAGIATDRAFHLAIGTSLAAILLTSASSARTHHGAGFVAWRAVLWGVIGGAAGSTIAAQIAIGLDQKFLKAAFGVMLFWVASQLPFL